MFYLVLEFGKEKRTFTKYEGGLFGRFLDSLALPAQIKFPPAPMARQARSSARVPTQLSHRAHTDDRTDVQNRHSSTHVHGPPPLLRLAAVAYSKRYSKALEYKYRVKTAALDTLKRYSILFLTLYLE
jgi:hypothetical protein